MPPTGDAARTVTPSTVSEIISTVTVGFAALGGALAWLAWNATTLDSRSPDRLVMELRLAQFSALLLVLAAGIYVGFALSHPDIAGGGLDIALAVGFVIIAAVATTWEPARALTVLALSWGGHALVDLAHAVDLLPSAIVPPWYVTACAIFDVCVGALCYLPVLRRSSAPRP